MRIAYVAAGAAGMYCGSCLHDNTLATALLRQGHEVTLIPTYTPLRTDEPDASIGRVFYGAINVYLEEKLSLFRHTPRFLDRLLNGRGLLNQVGRFAGSTSARELGALTYSVLAGEHGHQAKELDRLVEFLATLQPQVVQLTNALFLGFAGEIRRRLGVPVVCGLTGEDLFLDELDEPWRTRVHEEMRRRAADADGFLATSRYYAEAMRELLRVPEERLHVVPLGVSLTDVHPSRRDGRREETGEASPFVIGYLARIAPEKGLHLLLDAFRILVRERERRGAEDHGPDLRLRAAGWVGTRYQPYVDDLRAKVQDWGLTDRVEILGEVDRQEKLRFLSTLDVLSVPSPYKEPKGLYVLEAWAHGVPVVQPRHGAFPELLGDTGGGVLFEPGSPHALAEALSRLVKNPERARELGRRGRQALADRYHDDAMAARTVAVYERVASGRSTRW